MSKITITLNEGPNHEQNIEINGPVVSGQHFAHDGYLYRVINNGQYAQCCGRAKESAEAPAPAAPKAAKPAKKKTAKKKASAKKSAKKSKPAAATTEG